METQDCVESKLICCFESWYSESSCVPSLLEGKEHCTDCDHLITLSI